MEGTFKIDSVESVYRCLNNTDELKAHAQLILVVRNWLTEVSNFDPVSGLVLHTGIDDFLDVVAKSVRDTSPERGDKRPYLSRGITCEGRCPGNNGAYPG
jgi:hypothetical protein